MKSHNLVPWRAMGPGTLVIRTLLRLIRDIDGLFSYLSSRLFPAQYRLTGACKKRGICCQNIAVQLTPTYDAYPALKTLIINWYCFVYNFKFKGENTDHHVLIFECNYLKNKQCSIYWRRPFLCRNYPLKRYFGKPQLLPGCGYQLENRDH